MQEAIRAVTMTTGKSRLVEWKETPATQNYDKIVSGKIGSTHFLNQNQK